jgi:hypothetical protein
MGCGKAKSSGITLTKTPMEKQISKPLKSEKRRLVGNSLPDKRLKPSRLKFELRFPYSPMHRQFAKLESLEKLVGSCIFLSAYS